MQPLELFKKCSPDGRLAMYLEKRDFFEQFSHVDSIDGLVSFDPASVEGFQVFLALTCTCRYGREDLDVLGLTFQRDLLGGSCSIWPEKGDFDTETNTTLKTSCWGLTRRKKVNDLDTVGKLNAPAQSQLCVARDEGESQLPNTATGVIFSEKENEKLPFVPTMVQQRLLNRLGGEGHPFRVTLPPFSPSSVSIQNCDEDVEKPCGVVYELSAFIGKQVNNAMPSSVVCMLIRKLTYGPPILTRPIFPISVKEVKYPLISTHLGDVSLSLNTEKPLFYHGEEIPVDVCITNNSRLPIRKVTVKVLQITQLLSITKGLYQAVVDKEVTRPETPILPGSGEWRRQYKLKPVLKESVKAKGVALEGMLKKNSTMCLASSSIFKVPRTTQCYYHQMIQSIFSDFVVTESQKALKEQQGMVVSYAIQLGCYTGLSRVETKLPFLLMHPKSEVNDGTDTGLNTAFEPELTSSNISISYISGAKTSAIVHQNALLQTAHTNISVDQPDDSVAEAKLTQADVSPNVMINTDSETAYVNGLSDSETFKNKNTEFSDLLQQSINEDAHHTATNSLS